MDEEAQKRIVLLGTHGQFNLGDELLLETFLSQLGPEHRYSVNSYAPDETAAGLTDRFHVDVFDTADGKVKLVRRLWASDVVIFGGGSIVKELYPSTGRWRYATLCMVLTIVGFCRLAAHRPVLMSNIGVGPITTKTGRRLAGWILSLASLVSVRDQRSFDTCQMLGCRPEKLRRVPDAVWVNEPEVFASGRSPASTDDGRRVRIALNLNYDIENGENWGLFLDLLEQALRLVATKTPIELHALPMQSRFKEHHDLQVLEEFLSHLPDIVSVVHHPSDHADVGRIIADCDVLVAERLHALVIAATLGRASVALMYDVKVRELVEQLGLNDRAVDINRPFDPTSLADVILDTMDNAIGEGGRLAHRATALRAEAADYFDDVRSWLRRPDRSGWPAARSSVLSEV
jgi:polysaccharide pyruvyl transferase WcaK-like protein